MESLTAKSFSIADVVKALAFNVPVVERTAPCHNCYQETAVKNLDSDCLCEKCRKKLTVKNK